MRLRIEANKLQDFGFSSQHEWLETNGLGGWASSTLCGANTRRYHGLLVTATQPPVGRVVMLSKLEEVLVTPSGARHEIGTNIFPGAVAPTGFTYLHAFEKNFFPCMEYKVGEYLLRKTIVGIHGENTTVVLYELTGGNQPVLLELRPFVAGRDYHSLTHANDSINQDVVFAGDLFVHHPYQSLPIIHILAPSSEYRHSPEWYYKFEYPLEKERGLDFQEDLFVPGTLSKTLKPGEVFGLIVSTENPSGRSALALVKAEQERREGLLRKVSGLKSEGKQLVLAADQFVVRRGVDQKTIIAGYPWFTDWGRDTMIALPGLCLSTGRLDDAKQILKAFADVLSEGMLPNCFPDQGRAPDYNTVDATLWWFVAVYEYLREGGDSQFVKDALLPKLLDVIAWHKKGTRYGIRVDRDGLLSAGEAGVQLTWMDAKVGDWVVTPRHGKPIEVNALWCNALWIVSQLLEEFGQYSEAEDFLDEAQSVRKTFSDLFWNEDQKCLYDYVSGDRKDSSIRPNQLFALSLPFEMLPKEKAKAVLRVVEEHLVTPCGLRSLSPNDTAYCPIYVGDQRARDGAYHQGTVWTWLVGPYVTALVRYGGKSGTKRGMKYLIEFSEQLTVDCIGTIPEISDAEEPHTPRGCFAQAWSVAETLRATLLLFSAARVAIEPKNPERPAHPTPH